MPGTIPGYKKYHRCPQNKKIRHNKTHIDESERVWYRITLSFLIKRKQLSKVEELALKYATQGSELIVFPESFIPGYPRGFSFGATVGSRTDEGRKLILNTIKTALILTVMI